MAIMRFMTSLRFIDAVAREKSIRKAAEKLGTDKAEVGVIAYSIRD